MIDFRDVGFTDAAASFPRDELALAMFAAFNGVRVDQLPEPMRYFPNEATERAWKRVADAARAHIVNGDGYAAELLAALKLAFEGTHAISGSGKS